MPLNRGLIHLRDASGIYTNSLRFQGSSSLLLSLGFREKLGSRLLETAGLGLQLRGLVHLPTHNAQRSRTTNMSVVLCCVPQNLMCKRSLYLPPERENYH